MNSILEFTFVFQIPIKFVDLVRGTEPGHVQFFRFNSVFRKFMVINRIPNEIDLFSKATLLYFLYKFSNSKVNKIWFHKIIYMEMMIATMKKLRHWSRLDCCVVIVVGLLHVCLDTLIHKRNRLYGCCFNVNMPNAKYVSNSIQV